MKTFLKILEWTFFVLILCAIAVIASPFLLSNQQIASYSVVSGSMEPAITKDTLTFVQQTPFSSLQKGDIIAFTDPTNKDRVILHRINSIKEAQGSRTLQTKGDNNRYPDGWQVTAPMVKGKLFYTIPYVGKLSEWLKSPIGFGIMIGIPALIFIFLCILQIRKGIKEEIEKGIAKNENKNHDSSHKVSMIILPLIGLGLTLTLVPTIYAVKFGHVNLAFAVSTAIAPTHTPTPTPSITNTPTPKPTSKPCGSSTTVVVSGNGSTSTNTVTINNNCPTTTVNQTNNTTVTNTVTTNQNTGGNTVSGNTNGNTTITTGNTSSNVQITVQGASNSAQVQ